MADWGAWTDYGELTEVGGCCGSLSRVEEDSRRLGESLRCFPECWRCLWCARRCWVLLLGSTEKKGLCWPPLRRMGCLGVYLESWLVVGSKCGVRKVTEVVVVAGAQVAGGSDCGEAGNLPVRKGRSGKAVSGPWRVMGGQER